MYISTSSESFLANLSFHFFVIFDWSQKADLQVKQQAQSQDRKITRNGLAYGGMQGTGGTLLSKHYISQLCYNPH
jgi:hypothetical protein